jgi:5-formyltetrahydrofolate cyclo-ligase
VRPTALLVPLVGFDRRGYRLGYGGGYYDRTLAAMGPKPFTIGIGYEIGCLETIHPQPHDIPMHAIVTGAGLVRPRFDRDAAHRLPAVFANVDADPNSRATYASPPCFMHELEPSYLGLVPDRDLPTANLDESAATPRDAETE